MRKILLLSIIVALLSLASCGSTTDTILRNLKNQYNRDFQVVNMGHGFFMFSPVGEEDVVFYADKNGCNYEYKYLTRSLARQIESSVDFNCHVIVDNLVDDTVRDNWQHVNVVVYYDSDVDCDAVTQ